MRQKLFKVCKTEANMTKAGSCYQAVQLGEMPSDKDKAHKKY